MPITHTDGNAYFSQQELEDKIKDRVRGVEERVTQATTAAATWEQKFKAAEPELAKVATLAAEAETWKGKATQIETRYTAATAYGITDPDTLEALEAAHQKAMAKVDQAARVGLTDYLGAVKADPTLLPSYLRGVFTGAPAPAPAAPGAPAPGAPAPAGPARPTWASSTAGQQRVDPGATPVWADKVKGAKTLDELLAIQAEQRKARGR
jgi:hypothetical protein